MDDAMRKLRSETDTELIDQILSLRAELESAETSEAAWEIESDKQKGRAEAERERDRFKAGEFNE